MSKPCSDLDQPSGSESFLSVSLYDDIILPHFHLFSQELSSFTAEIRAKPEHHRFLIGRGGGSIRKVREDTGARIVFPTSKDEDKELITIIGKKESVEAAKEHLLKSIKDLVSLSSVLKYRGY